MIFFTSDTHFFHKKILEYCPNRKFQSVEEHDESLITAWNNVVKNDDVIFHVGDFAFGSVESSFSILDRLKGKKVLITGNHDVRHLKNQEFRNHFNAVILGYHEIQVQFKGQSVLIVLCHYPLESWNKIHYGSFHLHGHCHTPAGTLKMRHIKNRKDVGVDSRIDYSPWEKNELLTCIQQEGVDNERF